MRGATHIWVGFNDKAEARAFCWDDPGHEADTQATIQEWRWMGRTAIRLPKEDALRLLVECDPTNRPRGAWEGERDMPVPGFEDTNCPLCGNFDPEPWSAYLADAAVKWREAELRGDGTDNGDLYAVRDFADKLIAYRASPPSPCGEEG